MATLNQSIVASSSRSPCGCGCGPTWSFSGNRTKVATIGSIKDPLSLKYHRFEEEEYAILRLLDGRRSAGRRFKAAFESRYAPQRIALDELHRFVGHAASRVAATLRRARVKRGS